MSSALSITEAVNPPRAVYLDFPLGHTSGKAEDPDNQFAVMRDTLRAFEEIDSPGTVVRLPYAWRTDDSWKDRVMRSDPDRSRDAPARDGHSDDRVARFDTPQYQTPADQAAADVDCATCVFLEDASK